MPKELSLSIDGRPISKKNSRRFIPSRKRGILSLPSESYEHFAESAGWQLKTVKTRFTLPVSIAYVFEMKGHLDADVDNLIAGVNDILQRAGIIENDSLIYEGSFAKFHGAEAWRTRLTIRELEEELR